MYESDDIITYLFDRYGDGEVPLSLRLGPLTDVSSMLASAWRPAFGARYRPAKHPAKPLELYSFEASPFSRIVRERLCSLEIPYVLHNVAKGSPSRDAFVERSGKMMVPYLVDPNTGTELFESADIVRYLDRTYAK
jgi:glutathione S-transferase